MTENTINYISNHPMEHKLAAYIYYIERILNLPLDRTRQIILHIATSYNFPTTQTKTANTAQISKATPIHKLSKQHKMGNLYFLFAAFRKNTNLFKHTNVKIGFRCRNRIAQLTKPATGHNIEPHNKGGF
jgi:hypothetical protein